MSSFFKLLFFILLSQVFWVITANAQCPSTAGASNTVTDISCHGLTDGQISLTLTSGGTPTNYELYDNNLGVQLTAGIDYATKNISGKKVTFTGLYASVYAINIFKTGCPLITYAPGGGLVVNEPTQLAASPTTTADCDPLTGGVHATGTITLNPSGGTAPYTFLWNDSNTNQDRTGGNSVDSGTYSVTITDNHGCQLTVSNIVVAGAPATSGITGNSSVCQNTGGTVYSVTNTAGSTYAWTISGGAQSSGTNTNSITVSWGSAGPGTVQVVETNAAGCVGSPVTKSVTINSNATSSVLSGTNTICTGSSTNLQVAITGGASPFSVVYNDGTGNFNVNNYTSGSNISVSPITNKTYSLVSVTDANGCGSTGLSGTATITVTPNNTASAPSTTPTLCINTALTNITHTTTGATGITNDGVSGANGLPAGVSSTWAANTITISGTPTASGTFNYSIPLTGGCGIVNATGTITVNPDNTVSAASSTPTLCINTALTAITHTTTGATGIGAPTNLPAGVTAAWAANTITISGTPTASGTFNYSIPLTGGCGNVNATGTITVTPANTASAPSSTPTLCVNTALTAITHTTTGATGIGAPTNLPAGVTAAWAANTITISGTPTATGTFNYSIPLTGGCGNVNATGTITVNTSNTVSAASSTPTLCINTALTAITHTTTGATGIGAPTNLPAGVTAAWAANTITISGTPTVSGTFNYSIPLTGGCGNVNATGTITVNPDNTVGAPSSTPTLCINTALIAITHATTGATGIGAPTNLPAGVTASWAANTITISGTPTASGTFNYSIPLTGGCGNVNATGTITVNPDNTVSAPSSTPTLCTSTALTAITHTTTGATGIGAPMNLPAGVTAAWAANTITISGTPTASGTFNYSIPLTGGCGNVNATGTITVTPGNTASAPSSTPTLCINTALTAITHTTTGATGIGAPTNLPAGVTAAWAANTITISGTPTATGTFNYSIPLTGGCGNVNATGTITVNPDNTVSAASSTPTLCINTALTAITHTTTGATGIGAPTNLPAGVTAAWAANTITISGTPTSSGTFNYSIPLTGGCGNVNATGTITVTPANTASAPSSTPTLCINTALTAITHTTTGATGIGAPTNLPAGVTAAWAANTITISGTPTASGTFNYTIPLTGGCGNVNATGTITVNPDNTAGAPSSTPTMCVNTALTAITHATTGATGIGAPTNLPAGVTASWAANTITISGTPTATGTFNYTIPLTGGCGTVNASGTITVNPIPSAPVVTSPVTYCQNATATSLTATGSNLLWYTVSSGGIGSATAPTPSTATAGTTSYYVSQTSGGCESARSQIDVTINAAPTLSTSKVDVTTCTPGNDGSITVTASGGSGGGYTYSDNNGGAFQASNAFTNLIPGSYLVVVKDGNSCVSTASTVTISSPSGLTFSTTKQDVLCNGGNSGSITITPSGGSGTYTYSKDNGTTFTGSGSPFTFNSLTAATYDLVVQDGNSCQFSGQVTISQPNVLSFSTSKTDVSCNGASDGTITVTASGGTGAYQYSKDGGATFQAGNSFTGLANGSYDIKVKDANNCITANTTVSITQPGVLSFTTSKTDATTCTPGNDGTITVTASGGTSAYQYSKDNGTTFQGSNSFAGLIPGSYQIVVKDANNCTTSASSVSIGSPGGLTFTTTKQDVACNGGSNGSITITASGGTLPYQFSKDNGATFTNGVSPFTFSSLTNATYQLVVKDANTCTFTASVTVNQPSAVTFTSTKQDATCGGATDGSITVTASGGNNTYTYSKDSGTTFQVSNIFSNLAAGPYQVIAKDGNGCQSAASSVNVGAGTITPSFTKTDATCAANDGSIVINSVSGGTAPYSYSIDNGTSYQVSNTFSGLSVATYSLVVKDNAGCTSSVSSVSISKPGTCGGTNCGAFTIIATDTRPTCSGQDDGTITINVSGGSPNYVLTLSDASQSFSQQLAGPGPFTFTNLSPSLNYQYKVQDGSSNTCTLTHSLPIQTNVNATASGFVDAQCYNQAVGQAVLTVTSGGTSPYEYSLDAGTTWVSFTSPATITNLMPAALPYSILVRDGAGDQCPAQVSVTIGNAVNDIQITSTFTDATCANNDGSIQITSVSGGNGPYTYQFNGVGTTNLLFSGLAAGNNTFTVIDANNCTKNFPFTISSPGYASFTTQITNPTCTGGGQDGKIDVTISTPGNFDIGITTDPNNDPSPFQFLGRSNISTPVQFSGLSQGTYRVIVKPNGAFCSTPQVVVINSGPAAVDFNFRANNFVCFETKGTVDVFNVKGSSSVDFSYEIINTGNIIRTGTITQLQILDTVRLPLPQAGLDNGNYQVRVFQDQSVATGCATPISSGYKDFSINGPTLVSFDTLSVLRTSSQYSLATGSMSITIQNSFAPRYQMMLKLIAPEVPGQTNQHNAFDSQWINQPIPLAFDAKDLYAGLYQLSIRDSIGCLRTYSLNINLDTQIFIPNLFTPNNDGKNDNFEILYLPDNSNIIITNRWGKQVFASGSFAKNSDGITSIVWNGGSETDGIYYYTLSTPSKVFTGWVEVMRGAK